MKLLEKIKSLGQARVVEFPTLSAPAGLNIKPVAAMELKNKDLLKILGNNKGFAALTPTKVVSSEFSGSYKVFIYTFTPSSASDTITFVEATHKFRTIVGAFAFLEAGQDANLATIGATFSGLVVTLSTFAAAGTVATDWTGATGRLIVIAR